MYFTALLCTADCAFLLHCPLCKMCNIHTCTSNVHSIAPHCLALRYVYFNLCTALHCTVQLLNMCTVLSNTALQCTVARLAQPRSCCPHVGQQVVLPHRPLTYRYLPTTSGMATSSQYYSTHLPLGLGFDFCHSYPLPGMGTVPTIPAWTRCQTVATGRRFKSKMSWFGTIDESILDTF